MTRATPVVSDAVTIMRGQSSLSSAPISSPDRCGTAWSTRPRNRDPGPPIGSMSSSERSMSFWAYRLLMARVRRTPCTGPASWVGWRGVARPVEVEGGSDGLARVTPISGCARQATVVVQVVDQCSLRTTRHACAVGCHREERDQLRTPPTDLRDSFFETSEFRAAFDSQHIGKVFRAYRNHPRHLRTVRQGSQPRTAGTVARAHASPGEQARKRQARAESGSSPKLRRRPPLAAANAVVRPSGAKPPSSTFICREFGG